MHVLVVDDDEETLEVVGRALERAGHTVACASDVDGADAAMGGDEVELIVLDVMLGEASGLSWCASLRAAGHDTPILFLSGRGTVRARVEGLDAGGDDYLPKPFAVRELVARVAALGRRRRPAHELEAVKVGALALDFGARIARASESEVRFTPREWDLLLVLTERPGRAVTFDAILERVWGDASERNRASLDVIVSRLRRKMESDATGCRLRTIRGVGLSMEATP